MKQKFAKRQDGSICGISAINSEFTICGDAFDGFQERGESKNERSWEAINKGEISCPKCLSEIKSCTAYSKLGTTPQVESDLFNAIQEILNHPTDDFSNFSWAKAKDARDKYKLAVCARRSV